MFFLSSLDRKRAAQKTTPAEIHQPAPFTCVKCLLHAPPALPVEGGRAAIVAYSFSTFSRPPASARTERKIRAASAISLSTPSSTSIRVASPLGITLLV